MSIEQIYLRRLLLRRPVPVLALWILLKMLSIQGEYNAVPKAK